MPNDTTVVSSGKFLAPNGLALRPVPEIVTVTPHHSHLFQPARRRHSLAPDAPQQYPLHSSPSSRSLLTRNRRSFVFSSSINGGGPAAATSPTASLSSSNAQNAQIVAIDSKIEQAMVGCFPILFCSFFFVKAAPYGRALCYFKFTKYVIPGLGQNTSYVRRSGGGRIAEEQNPGTRNHGMLFSLIQMINNTLFFKNEITLFH